MRYRLITLALAAMVPACYVEPTISDVYAQAAKTDCTAPEHRQFDFWLGDWTVTTGGKTAGTNKIDAVMQGCGLLEQWTSARGGHGTSLNFYDRRTKTWSQAWIDEGGNALHLAGTFADGKMVLASAPRHTEAGVDVQRITWSKNADGSVRQVWESSTDAGKTWSVAFDGVYTRRTTTPGS